MDPRSQRRLARTTRLPRASGDGPSARPWPAASRLVAPRERGWTPDIGLGRIGDGGCPARAGMDRRAACQDLRVSRLPRASGDGPTGPSHCQEARWVAPRERGWTLRGVQSRPGVLGCPARAGMDPDRRGSAGRGGRLPRASGDGPTQIGTYKPIKTVAPRERGWTRECAVLVQEQRGCPARAGMDPSRPRKAWARSRLPRASGDGPKCVTNFEPDDLVAPRERGWTLGRRVIQVQHQGCPARAGMDPSCQVDLRDGRWLPRASGDGPSTPLRGSRTELVAPRERGWTRLPRASNRSDSGCPARAGMDPSCRYAGWLEAWLPRASGDGPNAGISAGVQIMVSPRERGWTVSASGRATHNPDVARSRSCTDCALTYPGHLVVAPPVARGAGKLNRTRIFSRSAGWMPFGSTSNPHCCLLW